MKIVDNRKGIKSERFSDLRVGDVFLCGDENINIKVECQNPREFYAVVLEDGMVWYPTKDCAVIKLNARVIVED